MFQPGNKLGNRFVKGQSGNPGGRPTSEKELRAAIQKKGMEYMRAMEALAEDVKVEATVRLRAYDLLLTRGYGKPPESIKISGGVTVEERKRIVLERGGESVN
jgi:hypothetical protein